MKELSCGTAETAAILDSAFVLWQLQATLQLCGGFWDGEKSSNRKVGGMRMKDGIGLRLNNLFMRRGKRCKAFARTMALALSASMLAGSLSFTDSLTVNAENFAGGVFWTI